MKTLANLSPAKGSNHSNKRLGRGIGSGLGKTSGRGHKGQKARKSAKIKPGFEGGQMPLYRRLPKRGFTNLFGQAYEPVNLKSLDKMKASTVGPAEFSKAGFVSNARAKVKLLGFGSVTKALTVRVHRCSANAKAAIEKAGGKVELISEGTKQKS